MLRDYQKDICRRTLEAFKNHNSVMVQMPTGTGKTLVLAQLVNSFTGVKGVKRSYRLAGELKPKDLGAENVRYVLIVAHRRELTVQIKDTIKRLGIDDGHIVVESIQTVFRRINTLDFTPSLVVIDEAHHALAKTYRMMWNAWKNAKFLGLTATPCRLNRAGFTDLFEVLITSYSIGEFIRRGWLSLFDYYSIKADSEDQRIIDSLEKRGADGDYQAKELNAVLNKRPGIERLYESICRYAKDKKGIVYAISIDHAHNIADYYREHGTEAVAVDSKTPPDIRKQTVEDFKEGKIKVMVSVDLFSEGFDCPDVEFIQLARPTLSLAKFLQMVGRGLRKSRGKESCVMIDNVGIYRMFGLPAAEREWEAMFEGRVSGKGSKTKGNAILDYATTAYPEISISEDIDLEEVIDHGSLQALLSCNGIQGTNIVTDGKLQAFKNGENGLYGLRRGNKIVVTPQFIKVFDANKNFAAVKFQNNSTGIVDGEGNIKNIFGRNAYLRLMDNDILMVTGKGNNVRYVDLRNGMEYPTCPSSVWFGNVEMLRVQDRYYDRTKHPYIKGFDTKGTNIKDMGFYIDIFAANHDTYWHDILEKLGKLGSIHTSCILANDDTDWYFLYLTLADGNIIVMDLNKNYYYVENGKEKCVIGNEQNSEEVNQLLSAISKLQKKARIKVNRIQAEKKKRRLSQLQDVEPFCSNNKWGLQLDDKIIVPPIYRSIRKPVGNYCAVELSPQRWGVIQLDGKVMVDTCYHDVDIMKNGTAHLTIFPGKTIKVKLGKT